MKGNVVSHFICRFEFRQFTAIKSDKNKLKRKNNDKPILKTILQSFLNVKGML
jgi:hypothetical protein